MATPVNQNSGIAARNGTTSHTVSFGFTSTTGNLLVFLAAASVTNAASGWTEQLNPVSATELSVYTKTSAGDSSITITHNSANYPMAWYVWEWAAGSSYHSGAQGSANNLTMPTLSGLPGTAVELFAALSVGSTENGGPDPSTTWTAGTPNWAELIEIHAPEAGSTDGVFLSIATAAAFTGTSVTPVVSLTSANPPISVANRQKVTYALTIAASAQTYPFEAAASTHAAADFTVSGAGAATIGFEAAGTSHAAADFTPTGSGAASVAFDAAATTHLGTDFTLTGAGSATVTFEGAQTLHQGNDFILFSPTPGNISFEPAATEHSATEFTVTGSGSATLSFDPAASLHGADDFTLDGGAGGLVTFEGAQTLHGAEDFIVTAAGAGVITFEGATTLHGAADFAVEVPPQPDPGADRVAICEHGRVGVCENTRVRVAVT